MEGKNSQFEISDALLFFRVALDVVLQFSQLRALPVVAKPFIGENFGRR